LSISGSDQYSDGTAFRLRRFFRKPWEEKLRSLSYRSVQLIPGLALPVRLPFGGWWLAQDDFCGSGIFHGNFENAERRFVERFLRPGMIVLDIGAHHGFYSLLASRKVGASGMVLSFEPSPRERRRLKQHLWLNRCRNVTVESCALGETSSAAELYLVHGIQTGCNSLRPPQGTEATTTFRIQVSRLDDVLARRGMKQVDFVKMDVEGAELTVLKGATHLLEGPSRPAFLAEVYDIRTQPWDYQAKEIIAYLRDIGYEWHMPLEDGRLRLIDAHQKFYAGNFVAIPRERAGELLQLISD
jgi:FkbM family methyltransferase